MTRFLLRITVLAALAMAVCCRPSAPDGARKPRFGFVINVSGARFWDLAHAGCLQAAAEEQATVDYQVPGESTAAQQKQIVEALIGKGIQGLGRSCR